MAEAPSAGPPPGPAAPPGRTMAHATARHARTMHQRATTERSRHHEPNVHTLDWARPGPMGRFKLITPIHSLEPRVAQYLHHNLKTLASTQKVGRPSPSTTRTAAAVRSSCDRTCFDHCDEVTPSVEKSISLLVQDDRRNRDSGRGSDWRIYRRLQFEVPVSS
ncbi:poly (ADP-ribose) glycohydrolase family protein [Dorcoceras hygrometricum]|uniref:Poly (ADP-ribose) glycohydrolase family protein n=1 Tax=Dorcoceras hygrometricum TaxID=472368 RepID=A0A2Z7BXZ2_9LAMI|nr:poly (ADP-ribose) glycohydrolase family protein [Dorcoceras hygrometricum]